MQRSAAHGALANRLPAGPVSVPVVQRAGDEETPENARAGKRKRVLPHNELVTAWEATPEHADRFTGSGADQLGALSAEGKVRREARSFAEERAVQTMRHIAIRLLACVQHLKAVAPADRKPPAESEIQGMLINDRIVLSSNINESIDLLEALHQQNSASFTDMLGMETPLVGRAASGHKEAALINNRRRAARAGIGRVLKPSPDDEGYQADDERASASGAARPTRNATGDALVGATRPPAGEEATERLTTVVVDLASTEVNEGLRHLLTSDEYKNVIILIKTANEVAAGESVTIHAEQKLIAALKAARISPEDITSDNFLIRGTKRPCLACGALLRHVSDNMFAGGLAVNRNPGAYFKNALRAIEAYSLGRPWEHPDAMEMDHEPTDRSDDAWHAQILDKLKSSEGHVSVVGGAETRTFETESSGYESEDLNHLPLRSADGSAIPDTWKKPADTAKKQKTEGKSKRYAAGETSAEFTEAHKTRIKDIVGEAVWEALQSQARGTASKIPGEQWRRIFALKEELGYTNESLRRALNLSNSTFNRSWAQYKPASQS
ncbi:hypothetical protein [Streptomyces albus]|uniref:hypothetical protein n=1 Tax=Streptomyces albus TaxID=1888 RepID=UPI0004C9C81E|nr:hypothetical protein [Streptomyces albus]